MDRARLLRSCGGLGRRCRGAAALVAWGMLAGCAARTPPITSAPLPPGADEKVNAGCYQCLQDALALYEEAPPSSRGVSYRAAILEVELLLAFRQRELGIPEPDYLAAAQTLEATMPPEQSYRPYIKLALATPWNGRGMAKEKAEALQQGEWNEPDQAALEACRTGSDRLKQYALLTVRCGLHYEPADPPTSTVPLLQFRAATCPPFNQDTLQSLLVANPGFTEAHYFSGRRWLADQKLRSAAREQSLAVENWPAFLAARLELATAQLAMEDFAGALDSFTGILASEPLHREALLGQARALAGLERYQESNASAEKLIAAGTWYLSEAWYQKASNQYAMEDYDAATQSANTGLAFGDTWELKRLLGFSHYSADRFQDARTWLQRVADGVPNDCEAQYFLGGAKSELREYDAALTDVSRSAECFDKTARDAQAGLNGPPPPDEDASERAGRLQRLTKDRDRAVIMHDLALISIARLNIGLQRFDAASAALNDLHAPDAHAVDVAALKRRLAR